MASHPRRGGGIVTVQRPNVEVTCSREPSDAAWRRFGQLAAAALLRLAERDALAATETAERAA